MTASRKKGRSQRWGCPFLFYLLCAVEGGGPLFHGSGTAEKRMAVTATIITAKREIPTQLDRRSPLMAATAAVTQVLRASRNAATTPNQDPEPGRSRPAPSADRVTPRMSITIATPAGTSETSAIATISRRNAMPVFGVPAMSSSSVIDSHDCATGNRPASARMASRVYRNWTPAFAGETYILWVAPWVTPPGAPRPSGACAVRRRGGRGRAWPLPRG